MSEKKSVIVIEIVNDYADDDGHVRARLPQAVEKFVTEHIQAMDQLLTDILTYPEKMAEFEEWWNKGDKL